MIIVLLHLFKCDFLSKLLIWMGDSTRPPFPRLVFDRAWEGVNLVLSEMELDNESE